jgi:hypothetical protein
MPSVPFLRGGFGGVTGLDAPLEFGPNDRASLGLEGFPLGTERRESPHVHLVDLLVGPVDRLGDLEVDFL